MPLVGDVLASIRRGGRERSGKVGTEGHMEEMVRQAEEAHVGLLQALRTRYVELSSAVSDTAFLQQHVEATLHSITDLHTSIEQDVVSAVKGSVGEVGGVVRRWKEVQGSLEAANTLLDIHTLLEDSMKAAADHKFLESAEHLAKVENLLQEASEKEIEKELDIMNALQEELVMRRTQLLYSISEVWQETLTWEEERQPDGKRSVSLSVLLKQKTTSNWNEQQLQQMLGALYMLGELHRQITTLGRNLMKHFFEPIIQHGATVKAMERSDGVVLTVTHGGKDSQDTRQATIVLMRLKEVFTILSKVLLSVVVNTTSSREITLMNMLGDEIGNDFKDILIKDCIADAIPYSRAELSHFDKVKAAAEDFQNFLVEKGFFKEQDKSLMEYAANVDVVFSNKACAHILERARILMKQPLHITVCITPLEPGGPLIIQDVTGRKQDQSTMRLEKLLSAKSLNMPKCQISTSVCDLVELIYETLEEACTSSPEYAGRLFYTVHNILTLYSHVVPTAHAHQLATLPQQAAIVHNNSMYLAHHALFLGHQYRLRLPQALRIATITTIDQAQELRKMASSIFLKAMQNHRIALITTLRESVCLDSLGCDASRAEKTQQGMRQVIHQLQLLHRVWQDVLPYRVYIKAISRLVSSVVEEVVARVVTMEDISADAALALITTLILLKEFVPSLFKVEGEEEPGQGEVLRDVALWGKFSELIVVLGASLQDIQDRWAQGKGPLAHEFTPDEAKQLVRALFQNTDRRAKVLARIK
ncbi:centromere/kinetochore protein zw10 homolog [Portunus trituberculatus]|uniref:Centromere/kinetochore protein zw10 n=1 Tax=Portunus trituberculatus TaxID=210409 RepID=A0A5B7CIG3_PORTR|nr:centromere/kinetochore protein zw10 homolog [Portunus trituberculatus]XP_045120586.1 centromere/kinetochore protein zw10 homolog [Portunus trituberculatus]MPC08494.1 Centromere/kinetochore protein zw10 [Portunus trituberculatus]